MGLHDYTPTLYLAANIDTDEEIIKKVKASFEKIVKNGSYHKIMQPLLDEQKDMRLSSEQ